MKAVILAGGYGTRLAEETHLKPKPMVEIGGKPILWHIMKTYSQYGIKEFVICCGYKGYLIKEFFANYSLHMSDVTFHMDQGRKIEIHQSSVEPWIITLVDTGESTQTGGRLARVRSHIKDSAFCMTYGDGLADINIKDLISHHKKYGKRVTLTAVQPPGRYGALDLDSHMVSHFNEKPSGDNAWVNGGFFVIEPDVLDMIKDDTYTWESDVLPKLARSSELSAFRHSGFWQSMDTLRDKRLLEDLWESQAAPWQTW